MIAALLLGRKGSVGFPGKNTHKLLGRPLAFYPMAAAKGVPEIDSIYLSTDDPALIEIARENAVEIIERPAYLATKEALGEHAYVHGYQEIKRRNPKLDIEILVLLFCNSATITSATIAAGIAALRARPDLDSAVSVSRYNMWSPLRARKLDNEGLLQPFVPFEVFGDPQTLNCDRDSQGDVLFADMGVSVIRPRNLDRLDEGLLPQKWMGRRIFPLRQEAAADIDYEWQLAGVEWWLQKYGGY